jgi:membrane-bound lytic murein transglycosylase B
MLRVWKKLRAKRARKAKKNNKKNKEKIPKMKSIIVIFFLAAIAVPLHIEALTPAQERDVLEQELKELEGQIEAIEGDITKTSKQKKSFQNEIYILRNKIRKLDLQIEQSTRIIGDLREQITDTTVSIEKTEHEIGQKKEELGMLLQRIYQEDKKSVAEIMFTGAELSDFFNNIAALGALSSRNKELLDNIQDLSVYLQTQKGALESEKGEEENFVKIQTLQKQESQNTKSDNEYLLEVTKGKESEYKKLLEDKQARAAEIRTRIFELIGVPDAPTFGEAVEIAQAVSAQTGVRAALLLAVLTQESNVGKNVGQCYITDITTGDGISVKGTVFKRVMKPSRDIQPFLQITQALGRDPLQTPVSCPIPSIGGYGGAMGPAQFIPSTWALYEGRLEAMLGRPADPWNIKDAFLASATYLADGGADKQTYEAEWCATIAYFSGSCKTRYRFYGDSVMSIAARYEEDIKTLQGN